MIGILGSGFGLYGYLPAVLSLEDEVTLLARSKNHFYERTELLPFSTRVIFIDEEDVFFKSISSIILSITPFAQEKIIEKVLQYKNINLVFLEKPLATNPNVASELQKKLDIAGVKYAIGYSFLYTDWFENIKKLLASQEKGKILEIKWLFKAHHHKFNTENWKRYVSEGGGVIRFYGIHLIALLTALGFTLTKSSEVSGYSENELFEWKSTFQNLGNGSICTVYVNSNTQEDEQFSVSLYDTEKASEYYRIINQASPFGSIHYVKNKIDARSFILAKYITRAYESDNEDQSFFYNNVNKLWNEIEEVSYFKEIITV